MSYGEFEDYTLLHKTLMNLHKHSGVLYFAVIGSNDCKHWASISDPFLDTIAK